MKRFSRPEGYAVVTGASSGLGKAFALELASRKIDTILISLPGEGIEDVCRLCMEYGTDSRHYEIDLTDREQLLATAADINRNFKVGILINNAGIGGSNIFEQASVRYINTIIQLNTCATTLMTHQLLPNLLDSRGSFILNISSLASLTPTGFKTVYPASKSRTLPDNYTGKCRKGMHRRDAQGQGDDCGRPVQQVQLHAPQVHT